MLYCIKFGQHFVSADWMIRWMISERFCAVLCTAVVHTGVSNISYRQTRAVCLYVDCGVCRFCAVLVFLLIVTNMVFGTKMTYCYLRPFMCWICELYWHSLNNSIYSHISQQFLAEFWLKLPYSSTEAYSIIPDDRHGENCGVCAS